MKGYADLQHSKSKVKNAGRVLRGSVVGTPQELREAIQIMNDWRACHSRALNSAQMGLRSRLGTAGTIGAVSQRLKRRWSIVDKLRREPTMALNKMQDIGGCRAIVPTLDDLDRVRRQWHKTHVSVRETDYLQAPKATGYRGIHLIAEYDSLQIEVQLRTQHQHAWSVAVEKYSGASGYDLKNGSGPSDLQEMFRDVSDVIYRFELDGTVPAASRRVLEMTLAILGESGGQ